MVRVELKCQRDFSDITLVFNQLPDSFEPELRGKGAFSSTSFEHASPHFHCFSINRISRCPELPSLYTFQAIYTGDEDIVQTAVFQFSQHIEPELRPFIFGQPYTLQFFLTFDIDAQC